MMIENNPKGRPNRVVTCQTCGVRMPQRYLARHMQQHLLDAETAAQAPAPDGSDVEAALPAAGEGAAPEVEAGLPGREPVGMVICPACAAFVAENAFTDHMQALHSNWCPICHANPKDLGEHLLSKHLLRPIQPPPPYQRNWDTQKRFICLGCKKKVSVWSYPRHEQPHGATSGMTQGKGGAPRFSAAGGNANPDSVDEAIICRYCQQAVTRFSLTQHLADEHPICPYCHQRQARQTLAEHIRSVHPDATAPGARS